MGLIFVPNSVRKREKLRNCESIIMDFSLVRTLTLLFRQKVGDFWARGR